MKKLYSLSCAAWKHTESRFVHITACCTVLSYDEAVGVAIRIANEQFPIANGYTHQSGVAMEVPAHVLKQVGT